MNPENLFIIAAVVIGIFIVVSILKKITKAAIFILIIFMGFTIFKAVQAGKTPSEVFNASKNDPLYVKEIYNYTPKIKSSVQNSISDINKSSSELIRENKNLHDYYNYLSNLSHGVELEAFHQRYCSRLYDIVLTSDTVIKSMNASNGILKNGEKTKDTFTQKLNDILKYKDMLK
jgi:hypothetical protein